mgnify:CR=1 FL=1
MVIKMTYLNKTFKTYMELELREKIAQEIENLIDPPPVDDVDYIIFNVIKRCAEIARGQK